MKFSIIIPTYNEANDIRGTLDALMALKYSDKEIIVVDDSTDETLNIVREYQGVTLIHPGGGGRCEARNIGILKSSGDVVCILNADVRLPKDFLNRLRKHYDNDADFVCVGSKVANDDFLFARFVDAIALRKHKHPPNKSWPKWTEGFSCRRSLAIKAGLFPTGFSVPMCAGEDAFFADLLLSLNAKKVVDLSIVVQHIAPATFKEYWHIRKGRGKGCPQYWRFLDKWSSLKIFSGLLFKSGVLFIQILTLLYPLADCISALRFSKKQYADVLPFLYAWLIEKCAFVVGMWESYFDILRAERQS